MTADPTLNQAYREESLGDASLERIMNARPAVEKRSADEKRCERREKRGKYDRLTQAVGDRQILGRRQQFDCFEPGITQLRREPVFEGLSIIMENSMAECFDVAVDYEPLGVPVLYESALLFAEQNRLRRIKRSPQWVAQTDICKCRAISGNTGCRPDLAQFGNQLGRKDVIGVEREDPGAGGETNGKIPLLGM